MVTFAGSVPSPTSGVNTMDYITITSTGNALDFGDIPSKRYSFTAVSNAHGGL